MAGYFRPKQTSLALFINLFQYCRLHRSHAMHSPLSSKTNNKLSLFILHSSELSFLVCANALFKYKNIWHFTEFAIYIYCENNRPLSLNVNSTEIHVLYFQFSNKLKKICFVDVMITLSTVI